MSPIDSGKVKKLHWGQYLFAAVFVGLLFLGLPILWPIVQVRWYIGDLKDQKGAARQQALDALVKIGAPAVKPLIGVLKGRDSGARPCTYLDTLLALRKLDEQFAQEENDDPAKTAAFDALGNL